MPRALILIADGYHDRDVHAVAEALQDHRYETVLAGIEAGATYTSAGGRKTQAERGYLNLNLHAYDLVVVPGGSAAAALAAHKSMVNIVYSMIHKGRVVAGIGTGVQMLVAANEVKGSPNPVPTGTQILVGAILSGRTVTSDAGLREAVEKAGARWLDRPVAVDGPVVTAQDVEAGNLVRFIEELVPLAQHYAAVTH